MKRFNKKDEKQGPFATNGFLLLFLFVGVVQVEVIDGFS
jgi:hypothetical protein